MAELHPNQVPYEAPEPVMINLAAERDYLSQPLAVLGGLLEKRAETQSAYEDNALKTKLADIALKAQHEIDDAKSLDANYDDIAAKYIALYNSTVDTAGAAGVRFLEKSPFAKEEFNIAVQTQATEKHQKQVYNRSKLDIAQWSSQIVNAPKQYQDALLEDKRLDIQNLGLTLEQTDDLLFDLQSNVDDYQIAYYIANKQYDTAKEKLRNGLPTVGASRRAYLWKTLQNSIEADSLQKAQEQKAIEAAKQDGTDIDAVKVLEWHDMLIRQGNYEDAEDYRRDFFYGKDLAAGVSGAGFSATARHKLYNAMVNQAKDAPDYDEYRANYLADLNRLSDGLMEQDGSLNLDEDEDVTPEQYNLARKLRDSDFGWSMLTKEQQVFVNNVLRGHKDRLSLLDLNPNTQVKGTTLAGIDYAKPNPVINYQALKQLYSNPANVILANIGQNNTTLTGREVETIDYLAKEYEKAVFNGDYKLNHGTRPKALLGLFAQLATKANPTGMAEVGLNGITRETFEKNFLKYIEQMKHGGFYEAPATYEDLVQDFKNIYRMTTGFDFADSKDGTRGNSLSTYASLALQYATKDDYSYNDYIPGETKTFVGKLPKDITTTFVTTSGDLYPEQRMSKVERSRQVANKLGKMETEVDYGYEPDTRFLIEKINEAREKSDDDLFYDYRMDILPASGMVWNGITSKERLELERTYNYLDDEDKQKLRSRPVDERIRILRAMRDQIEENISKK